MRTYEPLSKECKRRIELMLGERICVEVNCRVLEIKPHQLQTYMDELYAAIPEDLACSAAKDAEMELVKFDCETDEPWSFAGWKASRKWLWPGRRCGSP